MVGGCGQRKKIKQDQLGASDAKVVAWLVDMLRNMLWPRGCLYALLALAELACDHEPVCMHVLMYVCMYAWLALAELACDHEPVCMYVCMYVCVYVCMYACVCDMCACCKTLCCKENVWTLASI
jgi:hypothetical protein